MSQFIHLKAWHALPDENKKNMYSRVASNIQLNEIAVEKDWWLVHTLAIVFSMECAPYLVFKGGTSLSKGWELIERFSEDIDLALDREYLGFKGELSKADIRKLRRESFKYMTTRFIDELTTRFSEAGFSGVKIKYHEVENHDQDPLIIEIYYPKLTETDSYLRPGLLIEVGARSLKEPFTTRPLKTLMAAEFEDSPFADTAIQIPLVNPERTLLEKIFLLHEEFQRPGEKMRVDRLSRHLYDIEKLSRTPYMGTAFQDAGLFSTIVEHRRLYNRLSGVDYAKHTPSLLQFVPPDNLLPYWRQDYQLMQENMIYGDNLPFDELINKLNDVQRRVNGVVWS